MLYSLSTYEIQRKQSYEYFVNLKISTKTSRTNVKLNELGDDMLVYVNNYKILEFLSSYNYETQGISLIQKHHKSLDTTRKGEKTPNSTFYNKLTQPHLRVTLTGRGDEHPHSQYSGG